MERSELVGKVMSALRRSSAQKVSGVWACAACAEQHGLLTEGCGYASRGWCGLGGHDVKTTIRYVVRDGMSAVATKDGEPRGAQVIHQECNVHGDKQLNLF